jgi:hypothetical protein
MCGLAIMRGGMAVLLGIPHRWIGAELGAWLEN